MKIIKPTELSNYTTFVNELCTLKDDNFFFWHEDIHLFIALFDSFKTETKLDLMKSALIICFKLIKAFKFELARDTLKDNICLAFGFYMKELKTQEQLSMSEIKEMVAPVVGDLSKITVCIDNSEELEKYLVNDLKPFEYTIVCAIIKCFYPETALNLESMNKAQFQKCQTLDLNSVYVPDSYIELGYEECEAPARDKLILERVGIEVGRGTSFLTPFMRATFIENISSNSNWSTVYVNKIVFKLVIPLIDLKMMNYDCQAEDRDLIKMLRMLKVPTPKEIVIDRALKNVLCFLEMSEASSVKHLARFVVWLEKNGCCIKLKDDKLVLTNSEYKFKYIFITNSRVLSDAITVIHNA